MAKVNLDLLNRLVKELEIELEKSEKLEQVGGVEYSVALSKALGAASAICIESTLLTTDISKMFSTGTAMPSAQTMEDLFGSFKKTPIKGGGSLS